MQYTSCPLIHPDYRSNPQRTLSIDLFLPLCRLKTYPSTHPAYQTHSQLIQLIELILYLIQLIQLILYLTQLIVLILELIQLIKFTLQLIQLIALIFELIPHIQLILQLIESIVVIFELIQIIQLIFQLINLSHPNQPSSCVTSSSTGVTGIFTYTA